MAERKQKGALSRFFGMVYERKGVLLAIVLLVIVLLGFSVCTDQFHDKYRPITVNIIMDIMSIAVTSAIMLAAIIDNAELRKKQLSDPHRDVFVELCVAIFVYVAFDLFSWFFDGEPDHMIVQYILGLGTNMAVIVCAIVATYYVRHSVESKNKRIPSVFHIIMLLGLIDLFAMVLAMPLGRVFTIENGVYHRGKAWLAYMIYPTLALIADAVLMFIFGTQDRRKKRQIAAYLVLPILGAAAQGFLETVNLGAVSAMLALLICYCGIYLQNSRALVEKEKALSQSHMNALMMQINPHFVYNTIGSIASCCRTDPEQAETMLYTFSDYLRNNLTELSQKQLVPFSVEAKNLDAYLSIEKMRFPDIENKTDYQATGFELPGLSVQPLAENAITHGIMGRESGGTLCITSFETENAYCVQVIDDGVGFDRLPDKSDDRPHIGVANVTERLALLCNGTLTLDSTPGIGTTATITIPKR